MKIGVFECESWERRAFEDLEKKRAHNSMCKHTFISIERILKVTAENIQAFVKGSFENIVSLPQIAH